MQQLLSQATGQGVSVYIGDSASDLAAMLAADLGIVVGKSSSLRQVAAFCGVQLRPLVAGVLPALISLAPSAGDVGRPLVGLGWLVAGVPKVGRWKCATSMLRGRGTCTLPVTLAEGGLRHLPSPSVTIAKARRCAGAFLTLRRSCWCTYVSTDLPETPTTRVLAA